MGGEVNLWGTLSQALIFRSHDINMQGGELNANRENEQRHQANDQSGGAVGQAGLVGRQCWLGGSHFTPVAYNSQSSANRLRRIDATSANILESSGNFS